MAYSTAVYFLRTLNIEHEYSEVPLIGGVK